MQQSSLWAIGLGWLLVLSAGGCASQTIKKQGLYEDQSGFRVAEDAEIPDNTKNREVLNVVAQYQRAMTNKDFGTLKRLVAEEYYENSGTTDTTEDDYGSEKLPKVYELMANHAEEIKYDITVKRVRFRRDRALVEYEYEYSYKFSVDDKPNWDAGVDVNQLELVSEDGSWKIVSGL